MMLVKPLGITPKPPRRPFARMGSGLPFKLQNRSFTCSVDSIESVLRGSFRYTLDSVLLSGSSTGRIEDGR